MDAELAELDSKIEEAKKVIISIQDSKNTAICSTKFGPHSMVFLHLVNRLAEGIPVVWVDTGYNRRATLLFAEHAKSLLNLNLHTFHPENHAFRIPPGLNDAEHAAFTEEVKLTPFRSALNKLNATHWLSSVRAYQSPTRKDLHTHSRVNNHLTKVHPMLSWKEEHMIRYLERYKLPLGPESYDPTKGEAFRECGLHEQQTWS